MRLARHDETAPRTDATAEGQARDGNLIAARRGVAYLLIIATKLQRLERDVADILQRLRERTAEHG